LHVDGWARQNRWSSNTRGWQHSLDESSVCRGMMGLRIGCLFAGPKKPCTPCSSGFFLSLPTTPPPPLPRPWRTKVGHHLFASVHGVHPLGRPRRDQGGSLLRH
jgi:hypothetical protein